MTDENTDEDRWMSLSISGFKKTKEIIRKGMMSQRMLYLLFRVKCIFFNSIMMHSTVSVTLTFDLLPMIVLAYRIFEFKQEEKNMIFWHKG